VKAKSFLDMPTPREVGYTLRLDSGNWKLELEV